MDVVGHAEERLHVGNLLRQDAVDAAREALVDRGELEEDERGARVHVPVGRRPADLLAVTELVRLAVPLVVALLARSDEDVHRRGRDPRLTARGDVLVLACEARELPARLGLGDDHEAVALAEPAARRAAHGRDDPLDRLARDRVGQVAAHHAAPLQDVGELHPIESCRAFAGGSSRAAA